MSATSAICRNRCRISITALDALDRHVLHGPRSPTMEPVYVPTDPHEKEMQRALIQYRDPKNYALIHGPLSRPGART